MYNTRTTCLKIMKKTLIFYAYIDVTLPLLTLESLAKFQTRCTILHLLSHFN